MSPFSVELWGSHPGDQDDCWTGADFPSRGEAEAAYNNPASVSPYFRRCVEQEDGELWVSLVTPEGERFNRRLRSRPPRTEPRHSEWAWLQGMSFGPRAYNEACGFLTEEDWHE